MSRCKACNAELLWGETASGKRMPFNAVPHPDGEWVLLGTRCRLADPAPATGYPGAGSATEPRYTPHWATCPSAPLFRRRPPGAGSG